MSYHHRYKQRDFHFAHLLVTLRRKAGLTQEEVALQVGVADKSIRNWEGGGNYPTETHLRQLIELFLDQGAFEPEHEREEVHALWEQFQKSSHRPSSLFNEPWFAALLKQYQGHRTSQQPFFAGLESDVPSSPREQFPRAPLPTLQTLTSDAELAPSSSSLHREDWGEGLDVSSFAGRERELEQLKHWVLDEQCRLVALLGMGGIGETALSTTFAHHIAARFEVVIWRSLHHAPALEEILSDCLQSFLDQPVDRRPLDIDQQISRLVVCLRQHRCLLILDNVETLFQRGERVGSYRSGYEAYRTLLLQVGASQHQSCLLLTSREQIPELDLLVGRKAPVHVLKLAGLPWEEFRAVVEDEGIRASSEIWYELSERYGGNPLALKIVIAEVLELFGGDLAAFLREGHFTFPGIRALLQEQMDRLSTVEQEVLFWLAIERDLTSVEHLRANLLPAFLSGEVLEALSSLRRRNLIERGEQGAVFTLQPVVLEYVTDRLVEQVIQEILALRPVVLLRYALLQAQAKDYVRHSQGQLILQAVLGRLLPQLQDRQRVEEHLDRMIQHLRTLPLTQQGYGGGNVINLLIRLNGHLRGKDCSGLLIRQADLQDAEAQDAFFTNCTLKDSVFLEMINGIMCVALSSNGRYIAGGSTNGEIRVWHVSDGQLRHSLPGHAQMVWSLAFNHEGTLLASGSYDGLVKVWDVGSGQCVSILQGHNQWVRVVAFHLTSKLLATCSDDGSIRLWDLSTALCIQILHKQDTEIRSLAFSSDGQRLASGDEAGFIKLWDLENRRCLWSSVTHQASAALSMHGALSLAFSPDGELLVSGGEDGQIMVWEASSGKHLSTLSGHTDLVYSVSFSDTGTLASGSFDGTVKLWQTARTRAATHCLGVLQEHTHWICSIAFGPEGQLVTGSHNGVVKLWQVNREGGGKCLRTLRGYSCLIATVALSPDGKFLVSGEGNGTVRVWETRGGTPLHFLSRQAGEAFAQAFSSDGRFFAKSSSKSTLDNTIQIWEVDTWRCLRTLKGQLAYTWSVTFSADGRFLLSGHADMTIKLWEVSSGRCLTIFEGHRGWIWSLACSPDGRLLASGDNTGVIKIWQINSGQCLHTLQNSPKAIMVLLFTSDSQTLLSSNAQDLLTRWDVESGNGLKTIPGIENTYWLGAVALSADGNFLAAASTDQTVKVWDTTGGEILRTFPVHAGRLRSVAWSADQRLLACGTDEGTILLWEWQTGECLMTLRSDRPYERMNISSVTGITQAQRASLKALGAVENDDGR